MAKHLRLLVVPALLGLIFFSSCKKSGAVLEQAPNVVLPAEPAKPRDSIVTSPQITGRVIPLGTGSGNLTIDGATLDLKCNDVIQIQSGTYDFINVKNINTGCPITIQNNGLVQVSGNSDHWLVTNVSNLTISGTGDKNISRGFVSKDNPQHRSIILAGVINDLTIQNFEFKNIGDYVVFRVKSEVSYVAGDANTYTNNLKFLNIDCDNTSSFLQYDGGTENGRVTGLLKNLEIAYLTFKNSNCGHVVWIGNGDDFNIHHNTITDINSSNNNHNGIFTIKGSGSFHHNLVRNHQGNAIRAWAKSLGSTPKQILIYNNTVVNSRKYSAFEVQAFSDEIRAGVTTFANVKVYNNICGDLNKSLDWVGVILDVYNLQGGKCEVYDNIGFNFPTASKDSKITNTQSDQVTIATNNKYYATAKDAGINDINTLTIQK